VYHWGEGGDSATPPQPTPLPPSLHGSRGEGGGGEGAGWAVKKINIGTFES